MWIGKYCSRKSSTGCPPAAVSAERSLYSTKLRVFPICSDKRNRSTGLQSTLPVHPRLIFVRIARSLVKTLARNLCEREYYNRALLRITKHAIYTVEDSKWNVPSLLVLALVSAWTLVLSSDGLQFVARPRTLLIPQSTEVDVQSSKREQFIARTPAAPLKKTR